MAKAKGKTRFAGQAHIPKPRGSESFSEFPVGNKKGQGKHQSAGREDWMKRAYQDGTIQYYSDKPHWNKAFKAAGKNTNLNFKRVNQPNKADILNYTGQQSHDIQRTTTITAGQYAGQSIDYPTKTDAHGISVGPDHELATSNGYSAAHKATSLKTDNVPFIPVDDLFQTNTVGLSHNESKDQHWKKTGVTWHEVGHSLGLKGDKTLPKTDKSVMSYNPNRQTKFDKRDYRAINQLWKPYTSGKAYK